MNSDFRSFLLFSCLVSSGLSFSGVNAVDQSTKHYWTFMGEKELQEALNLTKNVGAAKNVILFVGDGMGPNTITATRIYKGGESSRLEFEKFPYVGLLKTYAVDRTVPDSACSATALFSGVKTNYEVAGLDANVKLKDCAKSLLKEHRLSTLIDWAQSAGKDTGFVTTTRVTHATPAALYSKSADRKWECEAAMPQSAYLCKDIARQLVEDSPGKNLKVIMGGGRQCFTWNISQKAEDPIDNWACRRKDGRDLIEEWKKHKQDLPASYSVLSNTRDLRNLNRNTEYVLGIFANSHMPYEDLRNKSEYGTPSLAEMTAVAIEVLKKNSEGFFLMVEGGLIDYAHHRGYGRRALEETVMFNNAVAEAVRLTGDDTLIVVTSDHSHNLNINGNTGGRSDILGISMNSRIDGVPFTTLTYATGGPRNYQYEISNGGRIQRRDPAAYNTSSFEYNQQAGIVTDEATHGGVDVPVFAKGPMAHLFHGVHEQSYVAHVISYAAKMGRSSRRAELSSCRDFKAESQGAVMSDASRLLVVGLAFFFFRLYLK